MSAVKCDLLSIMQSRAMLSDDGRYRYWLARRWADGPALTFVMLNPSTADASTDDPTIRRCLGFARREGCGAIRVVNLYAFRATDPRALQREAVRDDGDPVGPENDRVLRECFDGARLAGETVVAAWGAWTLDGQRTRRPWRHAVVRDLARARQVQMFALGTTKDGSPRHPLYVRRDAPLVPWMWAP